MGHSISLTLILIACSSCRANGPGASSTEDSAGVRIVTASSTDHVSPYSIVGSVRLAADDLDHPLHLVAFPGYIGVDFSGRVIVYNGTTEQLEAYDLEGRLAGRLGRKGGGPGEYQIPALIYVEPEGLVQVVDLGKNALVEFAASGQPLLQRSLMPYGPVYGGIRLQGDTALLHDRQPNETGQPVHRLRLITPEGDMSLVSLTAPTSGHATFQCPGFSVTLNGAEKIFAPKLQWTASRHRVVATIDSSYDVKVFEGAHQTYSLRRELHRVVTAASHVARLYPEGRIIGRAPCRKEAEELAAKFGVHQYLPLLGRLHVSPNEDLWVERYVLPGEVPLTDLFDRAARYRGTLRDVGFPVGFVSGGRLVGLRLDQDTGWYQVWLYRLAPAVW